MCINRVTHPPFTSRIMWIVDEKAVAVSGV
jgi:hypothetical protein